MSVRENLKSLSATLLHTVGCKVSSISQFQSNNNHASSKLADKNGEDENCINDRGDEFKVLKEEKE